MGRSRFDGVRRTAGDFLAEAFAFLHTEGVLPRPPGKPWIHVGDDYSGPELSALPSHHQLEAALEAAFPRVFQAGSIAHRDFATLYPSTLVEAAVARLTMARRPYVHTAPESQQSIDALLAFLRSGREAATCVRVVADVVVGGPFTVGNNEVIPVRDGDDVESMIERLVPEGGHEANQFGAHRYEHDRALLVARSSVRRDDEDARLGPFTAAADYADRDIDELIMALRLVTNATTINLLSVRGSPHWLRRYPPELSRWTVPDHRWVRRPAVLTVEDGPRLRRVSKMMRLSNRPEALSIALFRFNRSYLAASWWERIVDLSVALEAVFGEPSEHDDVTFRLRSRVASLLCTPTDSPGQLFDDVGSCYNLRSIVIHGSARPAKDVRKLIAKVPATAGGVDLMGDHTELLVDRFRDIVRRAILVRLAFSVPSASEGPFDKTNHLDRLLNDDGERRRLRKEWRKRVRGWGFPNAADAAKPPLIR